MLRFGFIATNEYVPWGGSELCWASAAEKLARRGASVSVSVKDWGQPVQHVEQLRAAGCRIFLRPRPTLLRRIQRAITRREVAWKDVRKVGSGADLLVVSQGGSNDGLLWMEAAKLLGIPYVVIVQNASEQWWPADWEAERLAACYEGARAAYFVSEANLALTRQQLASPLTQARVIRNPFNVRYDARPPWPEGSAGRLSLACVARLDMKQKGQDMLVKLLSLPHWRERDVRLTFAGSGRNANSIHRLVQMWDVTKNIEVAGFVDDIEQIWARHHALVLPSRFEGMPLALVEAMLCGRPCIVNDVGGNRELVRDDINGFLVQGPTLELLDETLNRAWENRHRLREMGEQAAADVRRWVSADPVENFVRELTGLIEPEVPGLGESQPQRRSLRFHQNWEAPHHAASAARPQT
jgi:glycosyltransferase involved in cell wall biosynthesis